MPLAAVTSVKVIAGTSRFCRSFAVPPPIDLTSLTGVRIHLRTKNPPINSPAARRGATRKNGRRAVFAGACASSPGAVASSWDI
jgi:hypothetical protein